MSRKIIKYTTKNKEDQIGSSTAVIVIKKNEISALRMESESFASKTFEIIKVQERR